MIHQLLAGPEENRIGKACLTILTESIGQGEFEQIADRYPQPRLTLAEKEKAGAVPPCRPGRVGLVGQEVAVQHRGGVFAQETTGEADPGILPDPVVLVTQEGVQIVEQMGAEIAAPGPQGQVFVVVRFDNGNRQVHSRPVALHRYLEFVLHADGGVGSGKRVFAAGVENLLPEMFGLPGKFALVEGRNKGGKGHGHRLLSVEGIQNDASGFKRYKTIIRFRL